MQIVNIITQYYPSFFKALGITLQMTVISLLCATVLGVIFGLFKVSDFKVLKLIADVYIDIIRGTPAGTGHDYDVRCGKRPEAIWFPVEQYRRRLYSGLRGPEP